MSDGPFRDDQEAAIARADALEAELAEAKRENEQLRAEKKAAEKAPKAEKPPKAPKQPKASKPAKAPTQSSSQTSFFLWMGGAAIAIVFFALVMPRIMASRRADKDLAYQRWDNLLGFSKCLRYALLPDPMLAQDAASTDPRVKGSRSPSFPSPMSCADGIAILAAMPAFEPIRAELAQWSADATAYGTAYRAIDDYYTHKDWQDDDYRAAPALWTAIHATSQAQSAGAAKGRDHAVPIVRAEIARYQAAYASDHGKDEAWWKLELGARLQLAADDATFGDASKVDAEMAAADAAAKDAPLEVRRAYREERSAKSASFKNYLWRGLTGKYSVIP